MECNKEEGLRALDMAKQHLGKEDYERALKMIDKAERLYPQVEGSQPVRTVARICFREQTERIDQKQPNWYKILDVSQNATSSDIKKAYHQLAKMAHPDKTGGLPGSDRAFGVVKKAFDVLHDATQRRQVDLLLSRGSVAGLTGFFISGAHQFAAQQSQAAELRRKRDAEERERIASQERRRRVEAEALAKARQAKAKEVAEAARRAAKASEDAAASVCAAAAKAAATKRAAAKESQDTPASARPPQMTVKTKIRCKKCSAISTVTIKVTDPAGSDFIAEQHKATCDNAGCQSALAFTIPMQTRANLWTEHLRKSNSVKECHFPARNGTAAAAGAVPGPAAAAATGGPVTGNGSDGVPGGASHGVPAGAQQTPKEQAPTDPALRIVYKQDNPKRGLSHHRYESYKAACTIAEHKQLGGSRADFKYDWDHGYVMLAKDITTASAKNSTQPAVQGNPKQERSLEDVWEKSTPKAADYAAAAAAPKKPDPAAAPKNPASAAAPSQTAAAASLDESLRTASVASSTASAAVAAAAQAMQQADGGTGARAVNKRKFNKIQAPRYIEISSSSDDDDDDDDNAPPAKTTKQDQTSLRKPPDPDGASRSKLVGTATAPIELD